MALILIIDHDNDSRTILRRYLLNLSPDLEIIECGVGAEGIADVITFDPDLIFTDAWLPDMGVPWMINYIRDLRDQRQVPIILYSVAEQKVIQQILTAGSNDYIMKPVTDDPRAREIITRNLDPKRVARLTSSSHLHG